jgi:pyridoxamine 5'-phosphate oxidase family protein
MTLSASEKQYLQNGPPLGRLATVDHEGKPHNVPVGYLYDETTGTIDIHGRELTRTRKFRNARANPHVCIVIDDVLPPWRPRCVVIRGTAQTFDGGADPEQEPMIRISPVKVTSWGLEP